MYRRVSEYRKKTVTDLKWVQRAHLYTWSCICLRKWIHSNRETSFDISTLQLLTGPEIINTYSQDKSKYVLPCMQNTYWMQGSGASISETNSNGLHVSTLEITDWQYLHPNLQRRCNLAPRFMPSPRWCKLYLFWDVVIPWMRHMTQMGKCVQGKCAQHLHLPTNLTLGHAHGSTLLPWRHYRGPLALSSQFIFVDILVHFQYPCRAWRRSLQSGIARQPK